jgi:thiol-disulfide isomerase/thioredoxin
MKYLLLLGGLFVFISCADKKKSDPMNETDLEVLSTDQADQSFADSPIPVYSFDMLEAQLLRKENDTTYIVNFWATWCKPCIKELPYFEQLGAAYSEKKLKVVLVSLDFPENLKSRLLPFIEEYKLTSEVILLADDDANTWIPKVSEAWEGSIPATLMFNARNRLFFERSFTYEDLEKTVNSIL